MGGWTRGRTGGRTGGRLGLMGGFKVLVVIRADIAAA